MTPREIFYCVLPAEDREDARTANAMVMTATAVNAPDKVNEEVEKLR